MKGYKKLSHTNLIKTQLVWLSMADKVEVQAKTLGIRRVIAQ